MGNIHISNLGKAYKKYPNKLARLKEWLAFGGKVNHQLKWVIQAISLDILPGEAVGVVGINGAGKSTLLKLIVGTIAPSVGLVNTRGRISALLELGMGFHPDFTGRQNVYMSGHLQGFSTDQINALMPSIEAFAEIGDYIDQPVRIYSSGMQVRLAFSVATAVRPDILIVDEALSVGDAYFQHKSFDRIREFNEQGTTLLLVSHSAASIQSICNRVILISDGYVVRDGVPEEVLDYYNASLANNQKQQITQLSLPDGRIQTVSGTGEAEVVDIGIYDEVGNPLKLIQVGQKVELVIKVRTSSSIDCLVLGYGIKDRLGQVIYGTNTFLKGQELVNVQANSQIEFRINFLANLGVGNYSIQTALCSSDTHLINNYEWRDLALIFQVINVDKDRFAGVAWLNPEIQIKLEELG